MVKLDVKQGAVWAHFTCNGKSFSCDLSAIRTARWFVSAYLESDKTQPSGKAQPVAYLATDFDGRGDVGFTQDIAKSRAGEYCDQFVELFTHPQPASLPLSDEQIWAIAAENRMGTFDYCSDPQAYCLRFARSILAQSGQ